jgi:hypothetical protein
MARLHAATDHSRRLLGCQAVRRSGRSGDRWLEHPRTVSRVLCPAGQRFRQRMPSDDRTWTARERSMCYPRCAPSRTRQPASVGQRWCVVSQHCLRHDLPDRNGPTTPPAAELAQITRHGNRLDRASLRHPSPMTASSLDSHAILRYHRHSRSRCAAGESDGGRRAARQMPAGVPHAGRLAWDRRVGPRAARAVVRSCSARRMTDGG